MLIRIRFRSLIGIGFVCMVLLLQAGLAAAQAGSSQISGTVKDSSGAVVPGASVSVLNERNGMARSTAANASGYYVMPGLPASTYTIRVNAQGFTTEEMKGVALLSADSITLNFDLKAAGVAETVLVSATQEKTVDMSSSKIGANVNEREVNSLPLNGRQLSQLYLQAPGSVNTGAGSFFDISTLFNVTLVNAIFSFRFSLFSLSKSFESIIKPYKFWSRYRFSHWLS
jgi:hypothetical protein